MLFIVFKTRPQPPNSEILYYCDSQNDIGQSKYDNGCKDLSG
jgi:hypothetical protein